MSRGSDEMPGGNYSGMTVNERLFADGLIDQFDEAAKQRDRDTMLRLLVSVEMTSDQAKQTVDTILNNPALYGF